jgi:glucokinase
MRVLAGDVGGTNCRLALCEVAGGRVDAITETTYPSSDFASLGDVVRTFLSSAGMHVRSACFGLPGPVRGRRAQLTNLPWLVDADAIERELGLDNVWLLNDLEAYAYGLSALAADELLLVKPGVALPDGNAALIAAGTGLGEAGLAWDGTRRRPFATEGGHSDFAPGDALEDELLVALRVRYGPHVSWERVVSGPGLAAIHTFLHERAGIALPAWTNQPSELPATIAEHATKGDRLAVQAVAHFLALYGAEAGNLALKVLATGGVYLGGGIAPKLAKELVASEFVARFLAKGRMQPLLHDIPVWIVLDDRSGLWGSATYAATRGGVDG